ncbi:hypothetical protein GCM10007315_07870 [Gemmobacter tilapiae]|uniref:DUF3551 domain-containing protein n=1 Tax=Neogemmobacter tilapiae TaxID=875041 RepID=A0A918TJY2_9RHOB|nr:hypothetical protein GCM10007315_07870 [Gemmobacter tilapiae]
MRLIAAIFALSSLAPSAKAEVNFLQDKEARADIALLQSCYEAAESWDQARGCINLTFDSCVKSFKKRHPIPTKVPATSANWDFGCIC